MPKGCSDKTGATTAAKGKPAMATDNTKKKCPDEKILEAKLIMVKFKSDIKVCRKKVVVPKDFHWKEGVDVKDGIYSKRPAVYLIKGKGGSDKVEVTVEITKSENISGKGKLFGALSSLQIEGKCPLSKGKHVVKASIKDLPDNIQWFKGDIVWGLEVPDLKETRTLDSTRAELFFVLGIPFKKIYQNAKGVWVEALRYLCDKANIIGEKKHGNVAKKITQHCHGNGLLYECYKGGSKYHPDKKVGKVFNLDDYLNKAKPDANCYDQASALQALCGAVGLELEWLFLRPFGYIYETDLLGWGPCNNPFFKGDTKIMIVDINSPIRKPFGNHAFCSLKGKILDACAKPHTGSEGKKDYVKSSIDTKTSHSNNSNTGKKGGIIALSGLTKVQ